MGLKNKKVKYVCLKMLLLYITVDSATAASQNSACTQCITERNCHTLILFHIQYFNDKNSDFLIFVYGILQEHFKTQFLQLSAIKKQHCSAAYPV
jgi:hypothetical protein